MSNLCEELRKNVDKNRNRNAKEIFEDMKVNMLNDAKEGYAAFKYDLRLEVSDVTIEELKDILINEGLTVSIEEYSYSKTICVRWY